MSENVAFASGVLPQQRLITTTARPPGDTSISSTSAAADTVRPLMATVTECTRRSAAYTRRSAGYRLALLGDDGDDDPDPPPNITRVAKGEEEEEDGGDEDNGAADRWPTLSAATIRTSSATIHDGDDDAAIAHIVLFVKKAGPSFFFSLSSLTHSLTHTLTLTLSPPTPSQ